MQLRYGLYRQKHILFPTQSYFGLNRLVGIVFTTLTVDSDMSVKRDSRGREIIVAIAVPLYNPRTHIRQEVRIPNRNNSRLR
jgi:hypothetical protein